MGGVSGLNINKCNQSTLFSRMIDFLEKRVLNGTYLVGRRQFNTPQKCQTLMPCHSFISKALGLLLRTTVWAVQCLFLET